MQNIKKQKSLFQEIEARYEAEKKLLKKKKFLLKAKISLTVILPVFIVLLSVKVIKTFIRIKVRDVFAEPVKKEEEKKTAAKPVPIHPVPVQKESLTPSKVSD